MKMQPSLFLAASLGALLLFFPSPSWQYVKIELKNNSKSLGDKYVYEDNSLFANNYANFPTEPGQMSGYLWRWEAFPNNGCRYIPPLPPGAEPSRHKWFALIHDLASCREDMIRNVRNAGLDLVIGYSNGSSEAPDIPRSLREDVDFPIVSITGKYAAKLVREAAAESPSGAVTVDVHVENYDVLLVGMGTGCLFSLLAFFCVACWVCYCRWRARRGRYTFTGMPAARRERLAQARVARRELIESILRQLQELQGEDRLHTPLGEARTRQLPQMTFAQARREGTTEKEQCAICVEEFQDSDVTRVLPCKHFFHPNCIDPWLTEHSSMCPLCKQSVLEEDQHQPAQLEESDGTDEFGTPVLSLEANAGNSLSSRSSASVISDAPLVSSSTSPSVNIT